MAIQAQEIFGEHVSTLDGPMLPLFVIYPMVLIVLYVIAILTGYGRRYVGEDGTPVKKLNGWTALCWQVKPISSKIELIRNKRRIEVFTYEKNWRRDPDL